MVIEPTSREADVGSSKDQVREKIALSDIP
jgi:hypothetical protein